VRVSVSLAGGLLIVGALLGWQTEERQIRCDDLEAVEAEEGVAIAIPSLTRDTPCSAGAVIPVGRFPRKMWEYPGGERFFLTTQPVSREQPHDVFSGAACIASRDTEAVPGAVPCVLSGVGYGFALAPDRRRIYLSNHDEHAEIVALEQDSLEIEARAEVFKAAHAIYDPEAAEVTVFTDQRGAFVHDAETLARKAEFPATVQPDRLYYDHERDEGLLCFASGPAKGANEQGVRGPSFMALGFETSPFRERALGSGLLARMSFSWGCGWNPRTRQVYAGVTTLGLLFELDYDTGDVEGATWIGPGTRPIQVDVERGLLYVGYFFDGRVHALRLEDGRVVQRWFAGRFVRDIQISRDRQRLWVTSNLGLVEISLPPV
jgi:hypothetical protein